VARAEDLSSEALAARISALERREIGLKDLPLSALRESILTDQPHDPLEMLLPKSVSNDLLGADSVGANEIQANSVGASEIGSLPSAWVFSGANQSVPNNAFGPIQSFDAEFYDPQSMHSPASPTKLSAPVSGIYLITAEITWDISAAGTVRAAWVISNSSGFLQSDFRSPVTGNGTTNNLSIPFLLNAGEYVEIYVFQDSGGPLNTMSGTLTNFTLTWLSDS
jgi:hypothetical protein